MPVALVAVDVVPGDPGVGVGDRQAEQQRGTREQRRARQPGAAEADAGDEHADHHQPEPALEEVDHQPQPGEPVGVLVEVHPVQRRGDHDQGEQAQRTERRRAATSGRRPCRAVPCGRLRTRRARVSSGGDGELREALVDVLRVGQPGRALDVVVPAEERSRLGHQEEHEHRVHEQHRGEPLEAVLHRASYGGPLDLGRVDREVRRREHRPADRDHHEQAQAPGCPRRWAAPSSPSGRRSRRRSRTAVRRRGSPSTDSRIVRVTAAALVPPPDARMVRPSHGQPPYSRDRPGHRTEDHPEARSGPR